MLAQIVQPHRPIAVGWRDESGEDRVGGSDASLDSPGFESEAEAGAAVGQPIVASRIGIEVGQLIRPDRCQHVDWSVEFEQAADLRVGGLYGVVEREPSKSVGFDG
ncbi:hypothetical protein [Actinocrinis sp.]|uniref:hypothetical protein n=1 Tax=Actinocrinis sp. TaxID=1920516 RepID=UPI002D4FFE39|nr:hypothetical protein [Actinocrinis sp.]HZP53159.1 hypothetical protein [Actinocrinis sp.]